MFSNCKGSENNVKLFRDQGRGITLIKVAVYQPFHNNLSIKGIEDMLHMFNGEIVVETIYDYEELLLRVGKGEYIAVFAKQTDHFATSVLQYYELMHLATKTNTKIYETATFNELTRTFMEELNSKVDAVRIQTIQSYIIKRNKILSLKNRKLIRGNQRKKFKRPPLQ